ncbi:hypothetical protein AMS68_005196 [Peltaster fructicola]|uniref:Uncharacterized protein n=1 Tax=Peltaster fructicola TaxID=286661 RepID=A0A6H0XYI0_9PEZI|nr:hypothetical protein AMS68_005196 [Peltaster fructicola]
MSDTQSAAPSRPQLARVQGRKRSFGRVFERIRTVFRRRDGVVCDAPSQLAIPEDATHTITAVAPTAISKDGHNDWILSGPSADLVVDDEENIPGSTEEPLISLATLSRKDTCIPETKARQLFERHGLTYHMRRLSDAEPAAKLRRVEKPVRMRVRWTCHSCNADFGAKKTCETCGHDRCLECTRIPNKKSKVVDTTTAILAATDAHPHAAVVSAVPAKQPTWQCTIQIGRPRVDSRLLSTTSRSHCHECDQPFESDQTRCSNCQHETCILCPVIAHEQPTTQTVPVVERVYKKPRQRVRYNCEHCNIQFTGRQECSGCGHERCETCPRFPPRKPKLVPNSDPAWIELQAKLATHNVAEPATTIETPLARL